MDFKEDLKVETLQKNEENDLSLSETRNIDDSELQAEAYIDFVESQGENFIQFLEVFKNCIRIAENYELIGNTKIKARIKDFSSAKRNTEKKALDDIFGMEIIPDSEQEKEWIMLICQLMLKIERDEGKDKENRI